MAALVTDTLICAHIPIAHALRSHLCRSHFDQTSQWSVECTSFSCHHCSCSGIASLKYCLTHVNSHLKRHEIICCMFDNCSFQTNIYGTYQTFKAGIVKNDSRFTILCNGRYIWSDLLDDAEIGDSTLVPQWLVMPWCLYPTTLLLISSIRRSRRLTNFSSKSSTLHFVPPALCQKL